MSEWRWEHSGNHHLLLNPFGGMRAKIWYTPMYGWCVYCWTTPPAQIHVPTLEEAKALAIALVKLN